MNKKIITIISVLALVTLLGCFLYFKSNKAAKNEEIGPVENIKEEIELNEIDTNNWQVYRNEEYGFEIKYPSSLTYVFQNKFDSLGSANILFYNAKYIDVANSNNPLLSIIDKNTFYIEFTIINRKDFINRKNLDIKNFLTDGLSGSGGEIVATRKIIDWIPAKTIDKKIDIYFYTIDNISIETKQSIGQANGAIWVSNNDIFLLEPKGSIQRIDDVYKNIALTFSQK
ncbi:MAG: hypothetical protein RBR97_16790 [Bacteroidales bacterium]|jgi:hypothetical protein|nr:hypothetical protein [Bacteroidales bacterium]